MKKRYLILAGLLVMTVAAAGCGKKQTAETEPVQATATPTPEVTKAVDMVDMQQTTDEDIKNIMGEKSSTASKIIFVNNTGDDIQSLYIRTHVDEDSSDGEDDEDDGWGDDLINGMTKIKHCIIFLPIHSRMQIRVQLPMISELHIQMKIRMSAFSVIFRWELSHRLHYAWTAQTRMPFLMQNI